MKETSQIFRRVTHCKNAQERQDTKHPFLQKALLFCWKTIKMRGIIAISAVVASALAQQCTVSDGLKVRQPATSCGRIVSKSKLTYDEFAVRPQSLLWIVFG